MNVTTEELEDLSRILLESNKEVVSDLASENLYQAIQLGHLSLESEKIELKHIDQSVKAGRQLMTFAGAVA